MIHDPLPIELLWLYFARNNAPTTTSTDLDLWKFWIKQSSKLLKCIKLLLTVPDEHRKGKPQPRFWIPTTIRTTILWKLPFSSHIFQPLFSSQTFQLPFSSQLFQPPFSSYIFQPHSFHKLAARLQVFHHGVCSYFDLLVLTQYSFMSRYKHFGGTYCLLLQNLNWQEISILWHEPLSSLSTPCLAKPELPLGLHTIHEAQLVWVEFAFAVFRAMSSYKLLLTYRLTTSVVGQRTGVAVIR